MSIKNTIVEHAIYLLDKNPSGLRFSELVREMEKLGIKKNTIPGNLVKLHVFTEQIYKPSKGLFKHSKYRETPKPEIEVKLRNVRESDFYQPFADWIVNEMEECTKAIPLGGSKFGVKWGTPDVIGIYRSRESDIVKMITEVICAEIKLDTSQIITAFGQVCAYRLFSHKSYIVVPKSCSKEDIDRIDSLAMIYGIGLVLFDNTNPDVPDFDVKVRAQRHEPDMYFLNENLKMVERELFTL